MKPVYYTLMDTFNDVTISRHLTVANAVKARDAHLRAIKARNGQNAYLTYSIESSDPSHLEADLREEIEECEIRLSEHR